MNILASNRKESILLFFGDICVFLVSLWLTLAVRHFEIPSSDNLILHLVPFSVLFMVWVLIFFVAGLYDKHTTIFKENLPARIFQVQFFNIILAAVLFFLAPQFGIAPKTNLVIYLFISSTLVVWWRLYFFSSALSFFGKKKRQQAILIGSGDDARKLYEEVNNNKDRYFFNFILHIDGGNEATTLDTQATIIEYISSGEATLIVGDSSNKEFEVIAPLLSNLAFLNADLYFIDIVSMYESIFDRVPLSLIRYDWYLKNVSTTPRYVYGMAKRIMDILIVFVLGFVLLLFIPLIYFAIRIEDGGPLFIWQERLGKNNEPIRILKFRSMDGVDRGDEVFQSKRKVTSVGKFLRRSRLDEFPQLWNVLKGEISLIGPRLELPLMVKQYAERIPYYNVRHVIKPGLTGWAQINHHEHPHHSLDVRATKDKLSYDLYYIKNRSFMLDIHIALKTARILFSMAGK